MHSPLIPHPFTRIACSPSSGKSTALTSTQTPMSGIVKVYLNKIKLDHERTQLEYVLVEKYISKKYVSIRGVLDSVYKAFT